MPEDANVLYKALVKNYNDALRVKELLQIAYKTRIKTTDSIPWVDQQEQDQIFKEKMDHADMLIRVSKTNLETFKQACLYCDHCQKWVYKNMWKDNKCPYCGNAYK